LETAESLPTGELLRLLDEPRQRHGCQADLPLRAHDDDHGRHLLPHRDAQGGGGDRFKVLVGGDPISRAFADRIGADAPTTRRVRYGPPPALRQRPGLHHLDPRRGDGSPHGILSARTPPRPPTRRSGNSPTQGRSGCRTSRGTAGSPSTWRQPSTSSPRGRGRHTARDF